MTFDAIVIEETNPSRGFDGVHAVVDVAVVALFVR